MDFRQISLDLSEELIADELRESSDRVAILQQVKAALQHRFERTHNLLDQVAMAARLADADHRLQRAQSEDHQLRQWVATRALSNF